MEALRTYLNALSLADQEAFAQRCGISLSYLRKAISKKHKLGLPKVFAIEKASNGQVSREQIRPDVDWAYIRGAA